MSENLLNALMELVALFARVNKTRFIDNAHALLKTYLEQSVSRNNSRIHIRNFYQHFEFYSQKTEQSSIDESQLKLSIQEITKRLNSELSEDERIILFLSFLELIKLDKKIEKDELAFAETLSQELHIQTNDYFNALLLILSEESENDFNKDFLIISDSEKSNPDELEGAWIEENRPSDELIKSHEIKKNIQGKLLILKLHDSQLFVARYFGDYQLFLNNKKVGTNKFIVLKQNDYLRIGNNEKLEFHELYSSFKGKNNHSTLKFSGTQVSTLKNKDLIGFAPFSFVEESGNLVAIICSSTLESNTIGLILSGQVPVQSGEIRLNGYNIHHERYWIHKMMGYVSDVAIYDENISIYDNLFFAAKLAFSKLSDFKINELVDQAVNLFGLHEISRIPIGKIRYNYPAEYLKLLINTSMEMIGQPYVLVLNLTAYNLSIDNAEEFYNILKSDCGKGRLTIITTTNAGINFLKKTDRLWIIDSGGYVIFRGPTTSAINYFKESKSNFLPESEFCPICGSINPDQLFQLINARVLDEKGKPSPARRVTPQEWYRNYLEKIEATEKKVENRKVIPSSASAIPNMDIQFLNFVRTKFKSLISTPGKQLLLTILTIIISFLIAGCIRTDWSDAFQFSAHENLPLLFFLNILGCLGIGILAGIQGTQSELKLINHNHFKNYSFFSYINAKLILNLMINVFLSILFTSVTLYVSNIKGIFFSHWLIYFSIMNFGNILGICLGYLCHRMNLLLSVMAGIVLINCLFSGFLIPYSTIPRQISSEKYVPVLAEIVPMRWAFEALVVDQVKNNEFEKRFFSLEQTISDVGFKINYSIPYLQERIVKLEKTAVKNVTASDLGLFYNELNEINKKYPDVFQFEFINNLQKEEISREILSELNDYLTYLRLQLYDKQNELKNIKDQIKRKVLDSIGDINYKQFYNTYFNPSISDYVHHKKSSRNYLVADKHIISLIDPIFRLPDNNYGRAHYFAPQKLLNGYYYETLHFNVFIIWTEIFIIYILILIFHARRYQ